MVNKNLPFYKKISISTGSSLDFTNAPKLVPQCGKCQIGQAGAQCKISKSGGENGRWMIWCDWDGGEKDCQKCADLEWVEEKSGKTTTTPMIYLRVSGNLTIQ